MTRFQKIYLGKVAGISAIGGVAMFFVVGVGSGNQVFDVLTAIGTAAGIVFLWNLGAYFWGSRNWAYQVLVDLLTMLP